ncbi:potassium channel family protein [Thiothrix subterranea]|uniref:TrkA family potassium uptake protein n=1 Tax=Thiothrix subterranea TaxID=2735563 RepID=A0AA51MQX2_9GAMM|nr:TrkA family potassium uptake protein [Thiothrix subterranea]MDQ5767491.1 TrkA family potassium uptake protein [Thiothrix subterranea]WML88638.1 TrkA family potassium uptake protein [Thiothrix subterranea]
MERFLVIGLGRFGTAIAKELVRLGNIVVGVDTDAKLVNRLADSFTEALIADVTDEQALRELNATQYDAVVVAIGSSLETSILCILHLKTLGVKNIWVKAASKAHHTILSKLGVTRVIHPEVEMGVRIAQALNYPMINQFMRLGNGIYLVEVEVKPQWHNKTLREIFSQLNEADSVQAVTLRRKAEIKTVLPKDFILQEEDRLVLAGSQSALKSLAKRWF